jgi:hypothetical protein
MGKFFSFSFSSAFILSFSILEDNSQCWRVCPISTRGRRERESALERERERERERRRIDRFLPLPVLLQ